MKVIFYHINPNKQRGVSVFDVITQLGKRLGGILGNGISISNHSDVRMTEKYGIKEEQLRNKFYDTWFRGQLATKFFYWKTAMFLYKVLLQLFTAI